MRRVAKASPAGSTSRHGKRRGLFGLACLSVLGLVALLGSSAPSAPAAESFPGQGFLPDNRAWEMVSPPEKNGGDVMVSTGRTRAAADGDAVQFASLSAFGDAVGIGIASEYIARRTAAPGTSGWSTHAVTPVQDPLSFPGVGAEVLYVGELSADLSKGVVRAWSPLTDDADVAEVVNLYQRTDLLVPRGGTYNLLSACPQCATSGALPPLPSAQASHLYPVWAGATPDFDRVLFESKRNLTSDAPAQPGSCAIAPSQCRARLYESHHGVLQLVGRIPNSPLTEGFCSDGEGLGPACKSADVSIAGQGAGSNHNPTYTPHVISADGSRVFFTFPTNDGAAFTATGSAGQLYMRANGTETLHLNASERSVADVFRPATYQEASADGSRVFFYTVGALTDDASIDGDKKLYMYDVQPKSEVQTVAIDATSGQFTLTFDGQTTADLAFDASAGTVQAALDALSSIDGVGGVVTVSESGGSYTVSFGGALAGRPLAQIAAADGSVPLVKNASSGTASVATSTNGGHLTLLSLDSEPATPANDLGGVLGTSPDGQYVYFTTVGQLIPDEPTFSGYGIFLWHEGELSFVGALKDASEMTDDRVDATYQLTPRQSRVSADGSLLFGAHAGGGLPTEADPGGFDHGACETGFNACRELYVYDPDSGDLSCASCSPDGVVPTSDAAVAVGIGGGASASTSHQNMAISGDGRYVFFSTGESLVEDDINGVSDAYVFDTASGMPHLLSSGESPDPSFFIEASADGGDSFFVTREPLSGWDIDGAYDLYDARIGGGLPEPPPAPPGCQGDACQPPPLVLDDTVPGSATFNGPGDAVARKSAARKRCPRAKRAVKRGRMTRCVRAGSAKPHRGHRTGHRTASMNRRASR